MKVVVALFVIVAIGHAADDPCPNCFNVLAKLKATSKTEIVRMRSNGDDLPPTITFVDGQIDVYDVVWKPQGNVWMEINGAPGLGEEAAQSLINDSTAHWIIDPIGTSEELAAGIAESRSTHVASVKSDVVAFAEKCRPGKIRDESIFRRFPREQEVDMRRAFMGGALVALHRLPDSPGRLNSGNTRTGGTMKCVPLELMNGLASS